jgi:hypothetical protein
VTLQDIAAAAQSLANYIYREGENACPLLVAAQIELIQARNAQLEIGFIKGDGEADV